MQTTFKLAAALVAGAAIGAAAVQSLYAQAAPPTYFVADISDISDPDYFKKIPDLSKVAASFGGKFIVRTQAITAIQGAPPKRFAVAVFESLAKAQAWYNSPEQQEIQKIVDKATTQRRFFVEGVAQ